MNLFFFETLFNQYQKDSKGLNTIEKSFSKPLVIFDGVCVLCNRAIKFLLKIDRHHVLQFTHLQSQIVQQIINRHPIINKTGQSVIFVLNIGTSKEAVYLNSDAVINILKTVGGIWQIANWFKFIPLFIRDPIYNLIAKKRYKWFGKYNECNLPSNDLQKRFLL